jgi:hypothetical protein
MRRASSLLFGLLSIFVCSSTAEAEFTKVGSGRVDAVRSSDISVSCNYRLRGALSATKNTTYILNFAREQASGFPTAFSYVLEGDISYSQLTELTSNSPTVFPGAKPFPSGTPVADWADQLRVEISSATAATVKVVSRGQLFNLSPSFFDLEKECGAFDTLSPAISPTNPSASCPALATRFAANTPCSCPIKYNDLTPGDSTPCGWLQNQVGECVDGTTTFGGLGGSCTPVKFFGPTGFGLAEAYVFDYRSCSCKLCNPWFYTRSTDKRSCECRYQTAADVLSFRNSLAWGSPQLQMPMFPTAGDACTTMSSQSPSNHQFRPDVIFDRTKCTCVACPFPTHPNPDRSACVQ